MPNYLLAAGTLLTGTLVSGAILLALGDYPYLLQRPTFTRVMQLVLDMFMFSMGLLSLLTSFYLFTGALK